MFPCFWPLIGRKYQDGIIQSKRPNMDFGRTTAKTTIYSHDGQKDRFVIFDRGAAKLGERSVFDLFDTTGVMFRSEIPSLGQKFQRERVFHSET